MIEFKLMQADYLKERAEKFLKNAEDLFEKEEYDLSAFNLEQACQLFLKYYIFLIIGDFPKTHYLKRLMRELGKVYGKEEEIEKLIEENISVVSNLEDAYIGARYLPYIFEKKQVENMIVFTEKLLDFLKKL
ncbi:MAG TPA: HEPN domain-containing protein [Candidatus Omnitrophica bacterium]|nr:HEPN domain-containing protein [Candidatus Omnitrophota bacterium]